MTDAIKPCPFCGRTPLGFGGAIPDASIQGVNAAFWIDCRCGGEGPAAETEEGAVAAWNTRAEAKP